MVNFFFLQTEAFFQFIKFTFPIKFLNLSFI